MERELNKKDWQKTQNKAYIELLEQRLREPKLTWVNHFISIINKELDEDTFGKLKSISVNDYGCNVGHFFRGIEDIGSDVIYRGFDISETYLEIGKKYFGSQYFQLLDIAAPLDLEVDSAIKSNIAVISGTLEHIENYECAIRNVFTNTSDLIILRTFVGKISLKDRCRTVGAKSDYLIRQFTVDELTRVPLSMGWHYRQELDLATMGESKMVCNFSSIERKQTVFVFSK